MAAWPKNSQATPCFCNFNCPPGSNPYHNYQVLCNDPDFPEFALGQLATWRTQTALLCGWALLDPDETIVCAIDLQATTDPFFDHAFQWVANVTSPTETDTFRQTWSWNDADLPLNPILTPACGAQFALEDSDIVPKELTITPVPDWICDLEQMREWVSGLSP